MHPDNRIYIAGHTGLIGSALVRKLKNAGFNQLLLASHDELDLTDARKVDDFIDAHRPEYIILAAGKVGGIVDNQTFPADFLTTNLAIQLNILRAAHRINVERLILFASSCMYPKSCPQPMSEAQLLTGTPEPTSLSYAISKLAGTQLCLAYNQQYGKTRFLPLIPNSIYGPNDNFDPASAHVLSALMHRMTLARNIGQHELCLWGSGKPLREFVFVDDIAEACILLLSTSLSEIQLPINIGSGEEYSIRALAEQIAKVVDYRGKISWDTTRPDGAPRKFLDSSRIRSMGWTPKISLEEGLKLTHQWYSEERA
jgi:GDP-L-fucose synthase